MPKHQIHQTLALSYVDMLQKNKLVISRDFYHLN